jgi:hypothetical protein
MAAPLDVARELEGGPLGGDPGSGAGLVWPPGSRRGWRTPTDARNHRCEQQSSVQPGAGAGTGEAAGRG